MIVITGIGWITKREYGSVLQGLRRNYDNTSSLNSQLYHESLFLYPIKNFGRFDTPSKMACCTGALALRDAGILYSEQRKQNIGIIGTNTTGSLPSDVYYFKDYVKSGRTLARGNLFIYTLPSSPLAEVAISFGLQGPLLYMTFPQKQISSLLRCAGEMILCQETSVMLAVKVDEEGGICFVLSREEDASSRKVFNLGDAMAITQKTSRLDEIVGEFVKTTP
jgi:3-oxoacyl-[acyl-carrier-protein] synthase II